MDLERPSRMTVTRMPRRPAYEMLVVMVLLMTGLGAPSTITTPVAAVEGDWRFDADGNDVDDELDALIAAGDEGPWVVDIHYNRRTSATDETILSLQYGVEHMYRYRNWDDILAFVDGTNVHGIAGLLDVYGVELLPGLTYDPMPNETLAPNPSIHAVRVREHPLLADGYDHNDAVFEDLGMTGEGVVIAIMDSGVDNTHVALDDMDDDPLTLNDTKLVQRLDQGGITYASMLALPNLTALYCEIDPNDDYGHGTAVAGIALGTSGGAGIPGMAPGARIVELAVPERNLSSLDRTGAFLRALEFVLEYNASRSCYGDPGGDIIDMLSISMGIARGDPARSIPAKLTKVVRSGVTVVISAGNGGPGTSTLSNNPEGGIVVANAHINLTVERSDDMLAWDSSRGPRLVPDGDGDDDDELMPHVTAPGHLVLAPQAHSGAGYIPFRGTSSAAPHLSGIAALMLEANALLRPIDMGSLEAMGDPGAVPIRDILVQTSQAKDLTEDPPPFPPFEPFPGPEPLVYDIGMFGLPWNNGWGYGLVDAYEAVLNAQSYQP